MIRVPPIGWPGGKFRMAKYIHEIALHFPHVNRVYLYGGGAGELWNWECEGVNEIYNDLDSRLYNFFTVLADPAAFEEFARIVSALPLHQEVFGNGFGGESPVQRAVAFFVSIRQSFSGRGDTFVAMSKNRTRRGMNDKVSGWLSTVAELPAIHARLSRVMFVSRDALEIFDMLDGEKTLFYVDPPYVHSTRSDTSLYEYEMSDEQHAELLDRLCHAKGGVIISGYESRLYAEKLGGWTKHQVPVSLNASCGRLTKGREVEILWSNF